MNPLRIEILIDLMNHAESLQEWMYAIKALGFIWC